MHSQVCTILKSARVSLGLRQQCDRSSHCVGAKRTIDSVQIQVRSIDLSVLHLLQIVYDPLEKLASSFRDDHEHH